MLPCSLMVSVGSSSGPKRYIRGDGGNHIRRDRQGRLVPVKGEGYILQENNRLPQTRVSEVLRVHHRYLILSCPVNDTNNHVRLWFLGLGPFGSRLLCPTSYRRPLEALLTIYSGENEGTEPRTLVSRQKHVCVSV